MTLGAAITKITLAAGETAPFSVRVPQEGVPQYVYDDDPDSPVDVPPEIVTQAEEMVAADA
jgi:hypothetical protein